MSPVALALFVALIVIVSVYLGVIVERLSKRPTTEQRVKKAYEKAKEEARVEKANLAAELQDELVKIRESIINSAQAYQNVVQAVQEKLASGAPLPELEAPVQKQLELFMAERRPISDEPESQESSELQSSQLRSSEPRLSKAELSVPQSPTAESVSTKSEPTGHAFSAGVTKQNANASAENGTSRGEHSQEEDPTLELQATDGVGQTAPSPAKEERVQSAAAVAS